MAGVGLGSSLVSRICELFHKPGTGSAHPVARATAPGRARGVKGHSVLRPLPREIEIQGRAGGVRVAGAEPNRKPGGSGMKATHHPLRRTPAHEIATDPCGVLAMTTPGLVSRAQACLDPGSCDWSTWPMASHSAFTVFGLSMMWRTPICRASSRRSSVMYPEISSTGRSA